MTTETPVSPDTEETHQRGRRLLLFGALPLLVLALGVIRAPASVTLTNFAFDDPGSNLTVQWLSDRGMRPVAEVGYPYGLLTLVIGKVWFGLAGLTPWAMA